jgi:hypothetical protein
LISDLGESGFGKTVSLLTEIGKLSFFNKIFVQHSGFKMNTNFPFKMVNFNKFFYVFFHVSRVLSMSFQGKTKIHFVVMQETSKIFADINI